ncbi:electron transporter SenC [Achromobacter sp.]|uniref:electron transporter SenC n=1 Tax=Achromobacter sp. TaxID=134375 RepID=UPI003C714C5F
MNAARAGWSLLLAAGMGLSLWQWREGAEPPPRLDGHAHLHDDAGKPARLYAWSAADAAQVVLSTPDATLRLRRSAQGWMAEPGAAASGFDAGEFLALFSQARSDRVLVPQPDQPYGLAPPQLRIDVRDAAGAPLARLDVGALAPDGLGRYVQVPGEAAIRIVPDYQTRAPLAAMARQGS